MSVTAKILRILLYGGRGTDDMILLATAMERGDDARLVFAFIDELETIGKDTKSIADAICAMSKGIIEKNARPRLAANTNPECGPNERWGYEGPVTPRLPDKEWWPLRNYILDRDGHTCQYCGDQPERMCADHVVPLSRGGSNDETNLVACCLPCNSSKCDRLLDEWEGRMTA